MNDNNWPPNNVPDLQSDFDKASNQTVEEETERHTVTVYEQTALEEQRDALLAEQHYTIGGPTEQDVHSQVNNLEEQIEYIRQRRESAQQKFRGQFRKSSRPS